MCEILTLDQLREYSNGENLMPLEKVSLKDLLLYYEAEILNYRYTYTCDYGLTVAFKVDKKEVCHLILGTVDKNYVNRSKYVGQVGYDNIMNGIITKDNLPDHILKGAKNKLRAFVFLPKLLQSPKLIIFNKELVVQDGNKYTRTRLEAKFMLYKLIGKNRIQFFLKEPDSKGTLIPYSFFPNDKDNYIDKQITFAVHEVKIEPLSSPVNTSLENADS